MTFGIILLDKLQRVQNDSPAPCLQDPRDMHSSAQLTRPDTSRAAWRTRLPWIPIAVSPAGLIASAFAAQPVRDAAKVQEVSEACLARAVGYVALARMFSTPSRFVRHVNTLPSCSVFRWCGPRGASRYAAAERTEPNLLWFADTESSSSDPRGLTMASRTQSRFRRHRAVPASPFVTPSADISGH